ncbi:HK97-gp10 family putative phage morphogenesis protein [Anaerorhabdus sp.]|uniref:HK97-gp10 family putative phage morphogenesis protein n=1 Tax=Anaerorhabdus sp. TaxID=1872524 RepID=UPI002FCAF249
MAKLTITGIDDFEMKLSKLGNESERIARKAVYEAAGVIADELKKETNNLDDRDYFFYGNEKKESFAITDAQKQDLLNGLGIAKFDDEYGVINTKISFGGYGSIKTKKYPKGVPNLMLAASINSGTSFRRKNPFIRRAISRCRVRAQNRMVEVYENEVNKIVK